MIEIEKKKIQKIRVPMTEKEFINALPVGEGSRVLHIRIMKTTK